MDPIVVAPQARGCCLIQESITIWTTLVANCVFLGVCASVCLFFCECLRLCACLATRPCTVCVNVFLPRHITMATALFGCSHAMWHQLTPPHEHVKLLTSSFVNLSFIIVASRGISICWPCNRERMWNCVCVLVGGWVCKRWLMYLCTCGEIITDYHNHIWLWRDIDFRPALFFMHVSKPIPSWLALLNWCPLCDRTWFQDIWAKGKISL